MVKEKRFLIKSNTRVIMRKDRFGKVFVSDAFRQTPGKPALSVSVHRKIEDLPKTKTFVGMQKQVKSLVRGKKLFKK